MTNAAGCDSVVTLDLTIRYSTTGTDVEDHCDSYTWIDGNTYTSSNNSATYTLTNAAGCDSVVTLDLTIRYSNTGTDVEDHCDSYTWIDGNTYTSSNNSATYTLTNAAGCDSVVTLDLTIRYSTTGTDVEDHCDSYTWIDGNTYTSSNNSATYTLTNAAGCDSVVTLDLTIRYSTTGTDVEDHCDSYTWIDGNTYTSSNNSATYTLTNAAGCDSVVTLDLTINYSSPDDSTAVTACDSFTWDGDTYYTSGRYVKVYTNVDGCDSTHILNLTINTCGAYCTLTQGFWGQATGKATNCDTISNMPALQLISLLLKNNPMVIGDTAESCTDKWRSLTIYQRDTLNVLTALPAGGPSLKLNEVSGTCSGTMWRTMYNSEFTSSTNALIYPTVSQHPTKLEIRNTLVGQTMAMSFNVRYDSNLSSLEITGDSIHTQKSLDCDSGRYIPNGDSQVHVINSAIMSYYGGSFTVGELLVLANNALSGKYTPGSGDPSLADITQALSSISLAFDECRLLTEFTTIDTSSTSSYSYKTLNVNNLSKENYLLDVLARPNPFNNEVNISLESGHKGDVNIEVIDALGRRVFYNNYGCKVGNNDYTIKTDELPVGMYILNVSLNNEYVRIKLIKQQ